MRKKAQYSLVFEPTIPWLQVVNFTTVLQPRPSSGQFLILGFFSAFEKVSISSRDHWFIEGSIFEGTSKLIWPRWGGERWIENNGQKNLFLFLKTRKGIEMEQKTQKENVWESACVCVCPYMCVCVCVCVFVFTRVFVLWVCAWERERQRERERDRERERPSVFLCPRDAVCLNQC